MHPRRWLATVIMCASLFPASHAAALVPDPLDTARDFCAVMGYEAATIAGAMHAKIPALHIRWLLLPLERLLKPEVRGAYLYWIEASLRAVYEDPSRNADDFQRTITDNCLKAYPHGLK